MFLVVETTFLFLYDSGSSIPGNFSYFISVFVVFVCTTFFFLFLSWESFVGVSLRKILCWVLGNQMDSAISK